MWADGIEAHKTASMCIDTVKSKYQLINKCKLLLELAVHKATTFTSILATFQFVCRCLKRNFSKHKFYFILLFMSKRKFYCEMEGVHNNQCFPSPPFGNLGPSPTPSTSPTPRQAAKVQNKMGGDWVVREDPFYNNAWHARPSLIDLAVPCHPPLPNTCRMSNAWPRPFHLLIPIPYLPYLTLPTSVHHYRVVRPALLSYTTDHEVGRTMEEDGGLSPWSDFF